LSLKVEQHSFGGLLLVKRLKSSQVRL